jgi:hypothetical protein
MSVTDAFRLLNSSLRGIREDERRHEETKMKIETDKARLTILLDLRLAKKLLIELKK